jgi:uncharacterized membrane protein YuzA (DUF378 family)
MVTARAETHEENDAAPLRGVRLMMHTLGKVVALQFQIYMLKIKTAIARYVVAALLIIAAVAVALAGIVFLEVGLFLLLTDVAGMAAVWAALIFAGVHLAGAAVLVLAARKYFKGNHKPETKEDSHEG